MCKLGSVQETDTRKEAKDMDPIQREKIAEKLKKIKALAERGAGGEKNCNANVRGIKNQI